MDLLLSVLYLALHLVYVALLARLVTEGKLAIRIEMDDDEPEKEASPGDEAGDGEAGHEVPQTRQGAVRRALEQTGQRPRRDGGRTRQTAAVPQHDAVVHAHHLQIGKDDFLRLAEERFDALQHKRTRASNP